MGWREGPEHMGRLRRWKAPFGRVAWDEPRGGAERAAHPRRAAEGPTEHGGMRGRAAMLERSIVGVVLQGSVADRFIELVAQGASSRFHVDRRTSLRRRGRWSPTDTSGSFTPCRPRRRGEGAACGAGGRRGEHRDRRVRPGGPAVPIREEAPAPPLQAAVDFLGRHPEVRAILSIRFDGGHIRVGPVDILVGLPGGPRGPA